MGTGSPEPTNVDEGGRCEVVDNRVGVVQSMFLRAECLEYSVV